MSVKARTSNALGTDVVVIGAGGAGQRAALEVARAGMDAVLVTKGLLGRSGNTPMGRFSFCVALPETGDSPEAHAADTLASGEGLADERLVKTLVEQAPVELETLVDWGMRFDRENGRLKQVRVPGHVAARALYFRQQTGLEITRTMRRQISNSSVRIIEDTPVVAVLTEGGAVAGALAVDTWTGEPLVLEAPAVIIAAGGAGALYRVTSNARDSTGDAYALGYAAGAELVDMEMTQFLPFGLAEPLSLRGATDPGGALITAGAWLLNGKGERFMARYDPERLEFSTRAVTTKAIAEEVNAGRGSPLGGVWLDLPEERDRPSEIIDRAWCAHLRQAGLDPDAGPLEVAPSCHHMMGGLRINPDAETSVRGLFAAGEAAGGLHGANRLAGSGLIDGQVFGAAAGRSACVCARANRGRAFPDHLATRAWESFRATVGGGRRVIRAWEIKDRLASVMSECGGVLRTGDGLETGIGQVTELADELATIAEPVPGLDMQEAIEVRHLVTTAELILRSALMREESRGAHLRSDFPERNDARFRRHTVIRREDGRQARVQGHGVDG